jgi:hypothetical protein
MTREEAKQNTWRAHCNFDDPRKAIHIVIDQIFDDHGEHLMDRDDEIELLKCRIEELIKPKTCEWCSNLFFDEIEKVYKCLNDVSDDVGYLHGEAVIRNIKDFHCVQHQPKDNK